MAGGVGEVDVEIPNLIHAIQFSVLAGEMALRFQLLPTGISRGQAFQHRLKLRLPGGNLFARLFEESCGSELRVDGGLSRFKLLNQRGQLLEFSPVFVR